MKKLLILIYAIGLTSCVASMSPAQRYAREHSSKEFTSWEDLDKKMDQNEKKKPKEHSKKNNY